MYAKYYKEELDFLRGMGPEFAASHPGVFANGLLTAGSDPDVERLLEGFAFLSARVRQQIDDEFPEIVHTLVSLLWPQFLRPTPSACIVEFAPQVGKLRARRPVPEGTEVQSGGRADSKCRFRTSWPIDLLPITIERARLEPTASDKPSLTLSFRLHKGAAFDELFPDPSSGLQLFLHEGTTALALVEALARRVSRLELTGHGSAAAAAPVATATFTNRERTDWPLRFPGLDPRIGLLPTPPRSFSAFRLLQEYFVFPERYQFVELIGLNHLGGRAVVAFDVVMHLEDWPEGLRHVDVSNFRLGCVPVANVFEHAARPFQIARERAEYPLVPDAESRDEFETFSVLRVGGIVPGTGQEREFEPLYAPKSDQPPSGERVYYRTRVRPSVTGRNTETWLSFVDAAEARSVPKVETVFADLLCSNGRLPTRLAPGDLREPTVTSPDGASFRDITRIMPPVPAALDGQTSWQLVSLIATSYLSVADVENLRALLRLMDFRSVHDSTARQKLDLRLSALESVDVEPHDWLVRGRPVRGRAVTIGVRDHRFGGVPDVYLFGSVLDVVFSMFSSVNSHTILTVVAKDSGERFTWKPRHGTQILQ